MFLSGVVSDTVLIPQGEVLDHAAKAGSALKVVSGEDNCRLSLMRLQCKKFSVRSLLIQARVALIIS